MAHNAYTAEDLQRGILLLLQMAAANSQAIYIEEEQ